MISRIYLFIILIFILIIPQGCDDGWNFDTPGCMDENSTNYDPYATFDNGSCYSTSDILTINASNYDDWIYYSFELEDVVDIASPQSSLDWDIAFKRNHMITNGGLADIEEDGNEIFYTGDVCAIVDDTQFWTNESFGFSQQIPDYECQVNEVIEGNMLTHEGCYNPNTHFFESCIKNPVLDNWGYFNNSYQFNLNNYQFFIKNTNGVYIKFWPISYYDVNGESGYISMTYQILD